MAKMVKTYRRDVIKAITKAIEMLRKKGRSKAEILFGIVKRFHPSKWELAYVFSPIQIDANGFPNYYGRAHGDKLVRAFNKTQPLSQEIIPEEKREIGANGIEIKRSLLNIAAGDNAGKLADKQKPIIEGGVTKEKRLRYYQQNGRKVKREADKLEKRIFS